MPAAHLTIEQARIVALQAQGLLTPSIQPAAKSHVLEAIRRMGALQIDTINVVARAPYFALWSRIGDYDPAWLDESLQEGAIFEYWAHAASFLPAEDFPLHRRICLEGLRTHHYQEWYQHHQADCDRVLDHVRQNGEVKSADFERADGVRGTWWNWKIEKDALEYWFAMGEMMISRRERFQRVYNLRERILPGWDDSAAPPLEEVIRKLVLKTVLAQGVSLPKWVPDYFRLPKPLANQAIKDLLASGELLPVTVEGWQDDALVAASSAPTLARVQAGELQPSLTTLLSPFDALIWDRARTRQLFGFDFTLECYLPATRRKYGYYLLPILHHGSLVGRMDVKAYRSEGIFEVKGLYLEPGAPLGEELSAELAAAIQHCAEWHKTPTVRVLSSQPEGFTELLHNYF